MILSKKIEGEEWGLFAKWSFQGGRHMREALKEGEERRDRGMSKWKIP